VDILGLKVVKKTKINWYNGGYAKDNWDRSSSRCTGWV
jgi:hypothetical protein